jgi:hypothetical protein
MALNNKRHSKQRALVLQGGGALGAYEKLRIDTSWDKGEPRLLVSM